MRFELIDTNQRTAPLRERGTLKVSPESSLAEALGLNFVVGHQTKWLLGCKRNRNASSIIITSYDQSRGVGRKPKLYKIKGEARSSISLKRCKETVSLSVHRA